MPTPPSKLVHSLLPGNPFRFTSGTDNDHRVPIPMVSLSSINSRPLLKLANKKQMIHENKLSPTYNCNGLHRPKQQKEEEDKLIVAIGAVTHEKREDDCDNGMKLLDHKLQNGFRPSVSTFTSLVYSYCKQGKLKKAFQVFQLMETIGGKASVQTYNCLLKGMCYVGRVEEAFELLEGMKEASLEPDIYTYTVMMDGFCKVGRSDEAMELLDEAIKRGLTPNVVTFNTLFNGYAKEGRPLEGFVVLQRMKQHKNSKPDFISYSTLLHGLLIWGEIRSALGVYKEMVGNGFEVDERLTKSLLRGLCRKSCRETDLLKHAYEVFVEIKERGFIVDHGMHCLLIQALCAGKRVDHALVILQQMVQLGCIPRLITWNCVIRALCFDGEVDEAFSVLLLLYEKGRMPSRTSYDLLIHELNQQGRFVGACNVYAAALIRGVVPCRKPRQ